MSNNRDFTGQGMNKCDGKEQLRFCPTRQGPSGKDQWPFSIIQKSIDCVKISGLSNLFNSKYNILIELP